MKQQTPNTTDGHQLVRAFQQATQHDQTTEDAQATLRTLQEQAKSAHLAEDAAASAYAGAELAAVEAATAGRNYDPRTLDKAANDLAAAKRRREVLGKAAIDQQAVVSRLVKARKDRIAVALEAALRPALATLADRVSAVDEANSIVEQLHALGQRALGVEHLNLTSGFCFTTRAHVARWRQHVAERLPVAAPSA